MGYIIRVHMPYNKEKVGVPITTQHEIEEAVFKAIDDRVWKYKTVKGVESRLRYILGVGGTGIDSSRESNRMVIKLGKEDKEIEVPIQIAKRPIVNNIEDKIKYIIEVIESGKGVTIPLHEIYQISGREMAGCRVTVEKE